MRTHGLDGAPGGHLHIVTRTTVTHGGKTTSQGTELTPGPMEMQLHTKLQLKGKITAPPIETSACKPNRQSEQNTAPNRAASANQLHPRATLELPPKRADQRAQECLALHTNLCLLQASLQPLTTEPNAKCKPGDECKNEQQPKAQMRTKIDTKPEIMANEPLYSARNAHARVGTTCAPTLQRGD